MAIPEAQLQTWSHQGAVTTSSITYNAIKSALESKNAPYADKNFEVFLQGSYGNDTNIRADSDVDIVIMLSSIFSSDLSSLQLKEVQAYNNAYPDSTYSFAEFKKGVIGHLQTTYGNLNLQLGNKSLKIKAASGRLGADVVVCHEYRDYRHFRSIYDQSYDNGILLPTSSGQQIINYPKLHSRNCTAKHQSTYSRFKPMVRILKNLRGRLVEQGLIAEGLAPSYFIEGLLYNAPGDKFQSSLGSSLISCINWILKSDRSKFVCPNEKYYLFGESNVQWSIANCNHFLNAVLVFWESW